MALLLAIYRPLLFCTVDPQAAAARGLPVTMLSVLFLALAALAISLSAQMMGALLVFTLLVGPAATANRLTKRPGRTILIAALLGLAYVWIGIGRGGAERATPGELHRLGARLCGVPAGTALGLPRPSQGPSRNTKAGSELNSGLSRTRRQAPTEAKECSTL